MKNLLLTFVLCVSVTMAAPVFGTLTPLSGPPGSAAGWGIDITPDANDWISFTGSFIVVESNPIGFYGDFLGSLGGPDSGVLAPSTAESWLAPFDFPNSIGLGYYSFDPAAPNGALTFGAIRVLYERFSDNPLTCGDCFIESNYVDLLFTASVADEVPEPTTTFLSAAGLALFFARRRLQSTYAANVAGLMRRRCGPPGPDRSV